MVQAPFVRFNHLVSSCVVNLTHMLQTSSFNQTHVLVASNSISLGGENMYNCFITFIANLHILTARGVSHIFDVHWPTFKQEKKIRTGLSEARTRKLGIRGS